MPAHKLSEDDKENWLFVAAIRFQSRHKYKELKHVKTDSVSVDDAFRFPVVLRVCHACPMYLCCMSGVRTQ